jgi:hypothetical protein
MENKIMEMENKITKGLIKTCSRFSLHFLPTNLQFTSTMFFLNLMEIKTVLFDHKITKEWSLRTCLRFSLNFPPT